MNSTEEPYAGETAARHAVPSAAAPKAPPRESFPLAIGETDHLETQAVRHHVDEKGLPKPPVPDSPAKET